MKRRRKKPYQTFRKKKKPLIAKLAAPLAGIVILLVAACVFFVFFLNKNKESAAVEYVSDDTVSLAEVYFFLGESEVNPLYGYTGDMDTALAAECVYPLVDTYEIPVMIDTKGVLKQAAASYSLYNPSAGSLVQSGDMELSEEGDILSGRIEFEDLIETDTDYVLDITLKGKLESSGSERDSTAHYYIRVARTDSRHISEMLELANDFSHAVYNPGDEASYNLLSQYLNTDIYESHNDFSFVTLESSQSQLTFDSLGLAMLTEPEITVLDIDGDIGCFLLSYTAHRYDNDTEEKYRVREYYRMRVTDSASYILNYERTTDQIFSPSEESVSYSKAQLGIVSDANEAELLSSSGSAISCFASNGTLAAFNSEEKSCEIIYGKNRDEAKSPEYEIKLISADDDGNVKFAVFGYMETGALAGQCGIAFFTYDAQKDAVYENAFIKTDVPYNVLKNTVGDFFYGNAGGDVYFIMDGSLYRADTSDAKLYVAADNITDRAFTASYDKSLIAYTTGDDKNASQSIIVCNLESGESRTVEAEEGRAVKPLGFLENSLVYGTGESGEDGLLRIYYGEEFSLLMDELVIENESGGVQRDEYAAAGTYYVAAESDYNRITVKCVIKEDGGYSQADDYSVYSAEAEKTVSPEIASDYDDVKRTVYYVSFSKSAAESGGLAIKESVPVYVAPALTISEDTVNTEGRFDGMYFVYAKGEISMITESCAEAIMKAYELTGFASEYKNGVVYRRSLRPNYCYMTDAAAEAAAAAALRGDLKDVTGIGLEQALYFTGRQIPWVTERDRVMYVVTGYDSQDNIYMQNAETGEESILSRDDADEFVSGSYTYLVE